MACMNEQAAIIRRALPGQAADAAAARREAAG